MASGYTQQEIKDMRDNLRAAYIAGGRDMNDPGIRFILGEIDEPTLRASLEIPDDWEPDADLSKESSVRTPMLNGIRRIVLDQD